MKRVKTLLAALVCAALLAVPVAAQADCVGDVDDDGRTGVSDLLAVISLFGTDCGSCPEDITGDGLVGVDDLIEVVTDFGCGFQMCGGDDECDDGDPCTIDICIWIKCLHIPVWGCDGN
jgi:hypothetical protein